MTREEAYAVLRVTAAASALEIKRAWRTACLAFHPDNPHTGDRTRFELAQEAYAVLKVLVDPGAVCQTCHGSGFVTRVVQHGFSTVRSIMLCQTCGGRPTGSAAPACTLCHGVGVLRMVTGVTSVMMQCPKCKQAV